MIIARSRATEIASHLDAAWLRTRLGHLQHSRSEGIGNGFEPAGLVVEIAEIVIHEGNEPDILAHLFDAHLLASEYDAEIDFLPIETDATARRHGDRLVVEWVVEVGQ